MKFLCIPCDSPMRLQTVGPPERGSLSVVYSCPECGYEIAMLTNAFETQIVQSLGVRIGPEIGGAAPGQAPDVLRAPAADGRRAAGQETAGGDLRSGTGCPFAAMIPAMDGAREGPGHTASTGAGGATTRATAGGAAPTGLGAEPIPVRWTAGAEARLGNVPEFVRPMARAGIERFARDTGSLEIDERVLDAAREFFGM